MMYGSVGPSVVRRMLPVDPPHRRTLPVHPAVRDSLDGQVGDAGEGRGAAGEAAEPTQLQGGHVFESGAWHCSYFVERASGGVAPLLGKLTSFSHTEWLATNVTNMEYIHAKVAAGRDLFEDHYGHRTGGLSRQNAAPCAALPERIRRLPDAYRHWTPHCAAAAPAAAAAPPPPPGVAAANVAAPDKAVPAAAPRVDALHAREEGDRRSSEGVASGAAEADAEKANRKARRGRAGAEGSDTHDQQLLGGGNDSKRSTKRDMQLAGAAREAMDRCHALS